MSMLDTFDFQVEGFIIYKKPKRFTVWASYY